MFNKLFAVCLLVEDFDNSLKFYKENLGLELKEQNGKYADFKLGETTLAIFEKSDAVAMVPQKYMHTGGGSVLAYQVKDLAKECKRLTENTVNIVAGPKQTSWGQKVAYFLDPDKNIWEVSEHFPH